VIADLKIELRGHPKRGQTIKQLMWIDYVQENGAWRIATVMMAPEPAQIKRSPDTKFEPRTNFDGSREVSLGGRITRVAFEADHTLVVVLMLDEEQLAFFPNKATLDGSGFNTQRLQAPRLIEIEGHPHCTNKFKTWAIGANLR